MFTHLDRSHRTTSLSHYSHQITAIKFIYFEIGESARFYDQFFFQTPPLQWTSVCGTRLETTLAPLFSKSDGRPRVDDRRVLSGIIFVSWNGLRWRDAPRDYGRHKTLYNCWKRWSAMGVFARMMDGLSAGKAEPQTIMIDAAYLKADRTASSLGLKKGV
ncbi:transposase [Gluconobacter japonicus]|nr:transposase [Gluconobacter japonicus]